MREYGIIDFITCMHFILFLFVCVSLAAPSSPVDVEDLCSVVVWKEPVMPNGEIVSYDVRFYRQGSSAGITRHIADTATFYVVQSNDTPSGSGAVYVQVSTGLM